MIRAKKPGQNMKPTMRLVVALAACLLVSGLSHVEEMRNQERLFLRTLGLSSRPRALRNSQPWRKVPSALWRMFQRSENGQTRNDPCTVPEYGVRGNIIRYVQDQGRKRRANVSYSLLNEWKLNKCTDDSEFKCISLLIKHKISR